MPALRLIFTRGRDPGSLAIRAQAWGGPWSHCGIVDGLRVIEARWLSGGLVSTPSLEVEARASRFEYLDVWCPDPEAGLVWARSRLAPPGQKPIVKYDHKGLLGIALRDRRRQDPDRAYCSEDCAQALGVAGLDIEHPLMHGISPSQIYWSCTASNAAARAAGMRW